MAFFTKLQLQCMLSAATERFIADLEMSQERDFDNWQDGDVAMLRTFVDQASQAFVNAGWLNEQDRYDFAKWEANKHY